MRVIGCSSFYLIECMIDFQSGIDGVANDIDFCSNQKQIITGCNCCCYRIFLPFGLQLGEYSAADFESYPNVIDTLI